MIDIGWQGIPNWIVASASVLTLGAAVTAGVFAGKAAHWTKAQAEAAREQVRIAGDSLKNAQDAGEEQRKEAARAYRRLAESRLDALAPTVYAVAKPADPVLEVKRVTGSTSGDWQTVKEKFEVPDGELIVFRTNLTITLSNVSDQVARIDIIDRVGGDLDVAPGTMIAVPPHEERTLTWTRSLASLSTQVEVNDPKHWEFNLKFWVRDLGMNTRDVYQFNADLRFFRRDGSRLVVSDKLDWPWTENVATPLPGRTYERLENNEQTAP